MADGSFKVIWRYKTPLEGRYIAQFANHMFTPGLSKDPAMVYNPGDNLIRFTGLEAYMHPKQLSSDVSNAPIPTEDDYDVICKIVGDGTPVTSAGINTNGVIYMGFAWLGASSSNPDVSLSCVGCPTPPMKESLVIGYKYGTRIYPLGKYTSQYWRSKGVSAAFLRRSLYGEVPIAAESDIEYLLKSFTYSEVNGEPVENTYVPATLADPTTGLVKSYILPVDNKVSFYDIPTPTGQSWHLVGYNTVLTEAPNDSTKLPLTILASATSRSAITVPAGAVAIAIVNWKGNATDSEIYEFSNVTRTSTSEDVDIVLHNHALI